jgi:hypothetical protein
MPQVAMQAPEVISVREGEGAATGACERLPEISRDQAGCRCRKPICWKRWLCTTRRAVASHERLGASHRSSSRDIWRRLVSPDLGDDGAETWLGTGRMCTTEMIPAQGPAGGGLPRS